MRVSDDYMLYMYLRDKLSDERVWRIQYLRRANVDALNPSLCGKTYGETQSSNSKNERGHIPQENCAALLRDLGDKNVFIYAGASRSG